MEKDNKKNNIKKNNKNSKHKKWLSLIILVLLSLSMACGFNIYTHNSKNCEVSYNDFIASIEKGEIKEVSINMNTAKITYKDKNNFLYHYTTYPGTDDFIENLLVKDVKVKIKNTSSYSSYIQIAIYAALFIGVFYMMTNVGNEDVEMHSVENNNVTFDNVAGMHELKNDLSFIAEMMKNPSYRESGARIPKGILLEGPPGNGKTLISKAFAGEAGVNFIAVNACDFGSKFVGVGSMKVNKIFKEAKEKAPCVLFIDELDAIGEKRASASDAAGKEFNTILTALLNQMDGFTQNENVLVLAATNRSDSLDPALLRPGRFDKKFIVDIPDKLTRKELFEFATKEITLAEEVTFDKLADKTYGCSCSEITSIVNDAIINSVKNERTFINMADFEKAILETELKGHVKESYEQSDREKRIVAYHEAGHAIVSHFHSKKKVSNITIKPTTSGAGGFTITEETPEDLTPILDIKNRIVMCYGGRAAETYLLGSVEKASAGASQDIREATRMAMNYVLIHEGVDFTQFGETGDKEVSERAKALLKECAKEAMELVNSKSEYLTAVAEKLIENEVMDETEFLNVISQVDNQNA